MTKILIAGDIHMDTSQVAYLISTAKKTGCDRIVNVGDFGYWPHVEDGKKFLRKVQRMLVDADLTLYWIDGNHENFNALIDLQNNETKTMGGDGYHDFLPIVSIEDLPPSIFYIPRGFAWEWDGIKFLGMGGAISIDRDWRQQRERETGKPGTLYWPQEAIVEADIERGLQNAAALGGVDILLCHDAPKYVQIPMQLMNVDLKGLDTQTNINRSLLNRLVEGLIEQDNTPSIMFHGHYHLRHEIPYARPGITIPCIGLDRDGAYNSSWYVIDTEEFVPVKDIS